MTAASAQTPALPPLTSKSTTPPPPPTLRSYTPAPTASARVPLDFQSARKRKKPVSPDKKLEVAPAPLVEHVVGDDPVVDVSDKSPPSDNLINPSPMDYGQGEVVPPRNGKRPYLAGDQLVDDLPSSDGDSVAKGPVVPISMLRVNPMTSLFAAASEDAVAYASEEEGSNLGRNVIMLTACTHYGMFGRSGASAENAWTRRD